MDAADTIPVESNDSETVEISVIGRDILVTGDIETEIDLHVEGRIVGNVRCNTLILGEGSCVAGNINAERVLVAGMVKGSIETGDLAIESSAQVKGNVTYSRIRISNGGVIDGRFKHRPVRIDKVGAAPTRNVRAAPAKVKLIGAASEEEAAGR